MFTLNGRKAKVFIAVNSLRQIFPVQRTRTQIPLQTSGFFVTKIEISLKLPDGLLMIAESWDR